VNSEQLNKTTVISCCDMGLSYSDFFRVYPKLFPDAHIALKSDGAHSSWKTGEKVDISLSKEKTRTLGFLKFPIIDIQLTFENMNRACIKSYMQTFHQGFQKGGG
jgi:hypothetical protein|tara:strand:+ start:6629 stop:6943 length:315 start_codon:yes stop_codon:yes gene_type:complete